MGELDNTILVVLADNGASQEGGPFGVMHEMKFFNGLLDAPDEIGEHIEDIGGPNSHTNYPWGWAQAGNSPFKWYKQNTHEGGVHVPMVFHWPAGVDAAQAGSKRNQFVNVSDITPTIYEILGVSAPEVFKGIEQMPMTGDSFASTLADASAPATNTLQYFENGGSRAVIVEQDGAWWKAVSRHQSGVDFEDDVWELYRLS
jgi:arylsulfatase